ncbi:MAG: hypothetical protein SGBAC_008539, partial [Bacillariaceae sp.]
MKPPNASQLVTLAAACASSSYAADPSATTVSTGTFSSLLQVPGGSIHSTATTTQAREGHRAFISSSVLPVRGGASSDDKSSQNTSESKQASAPARQKTTSSKSKSKKNKKKKSTQNSQRERADSQSKKQGSQKKDAATTTSDNDAPTTDSQSYPNQEIVEEIVEQTDYYEILGIPNHKKGSVTKVEIQKAYRKRALQVHPDKTGGDRRAFDKVAESFDVLSDDGKREIYNRYGKEGIENGAGGATGAGQFQDIFQSMFQQAGGQRQSFGRTRQNYTMRYQIEVTLEDLYNGATQDVLVTAPSTERRKPKSVEVHIPKGSISGQSIVLSGEMDFADDTPGDLIFVVSQRPHPVFTRKGHDL